MKTKELEILADALTFLTFSNLLQRTLKSVKTPLDLGDFPSEPVRLECDPGPAGTGKLLVRFYPSDRFLDFAATIFTRDLNFATIKEYSHIKPPIIAITAGIDIQKNGFYARIQCHLKK
jgi:hypothetical protein